MTDVEGSASIVCKWIVLVGNKACLRCSPARKEPARTSARVGVAIGKIQNIKSKQRNSAAGINANICHQLVLAENSARSVSINILVRLAWSWARGNVGCIDIVDIERMLTARIQVRHRYVRVFRDLAFDTRSALNGVGRAQIG